LTHLWQIQSWSIFSLFETVHAAEQVIAEIAAHADITILSQKVDLQIQTYFTEISRRLRSK
jgi:lipopolysaccharide/colanic/teichoic acid biosynthesis glycosyltransferase